MCVFFSLLLLLFSYSIFRIGFVYLPPWPRAAAECGQRERGREVGERAEEGEQESEWERAKRHSSLWPRGHPSIQLGSMPGPNLPPSLPSLPLSTRLFAKGKRAPFSRFPSQRFVYLPLNSIKRAARGVPQKGRE